MMSLGHQHQSLLLLGTQHLHLRQITSVQHSLTHRHKCRVLGEHRIQTCLLTGEHGLLLLLEHEKLLLLLLLLQKQVGFSFQKPFRVSLHLVGSNLLGDTALVGTILALRELLLVHLRV